MNRSGWIVLAVAGALLFALLVGRCPSTSDAQLQAARETAFTDGRAVGLAIRGCQREPDPIGRREQCNTLSSYLELGKVHSAAVRQEVENVLDAASYSQK